MHKKELLSLNKKLRIAIIFVVFLLLGYIRDIFLPTLISSIQLPLPFSSYYILFSNIITFVISVFVLAAMTRNNIYSKRLIASLKGNIVLYFGIVFITGIIETYLRRSILVLMLGRVIVLYFIYMLSMFLITQGKLKKFHMNIKHFIFLAVGIIYVGAIIYVLPSVTFSNFGIINLISKTAPMIYWAAGATMFFVYYEKKNELA